MYYYVLQRIETRELAPHSWLGRDIFVWPVHTTVTAATGATIAYDAINIRQIDAKTGRFTKKGAFLRPNRWAALKGQEQKITANIGAKERIQFNLGGGIMGASGGRCAGVSVRKFWRPAGTLDVLPTKNGIELTVAEWARLVAMTSALEAPSQELREALECGLSHDGQRAAQACTECHPFDI
jgi:hypothetical protein